MNKRVAVFKKIEIFIVLFFLIAVGSLLPEDPGVQLLDDATYMEMESVGRVQISPDGSRVLFTRTWVDKINDRSRSNIWLTDINGKRIRELTQGNWRDSSPAWSPGGEKIAFISDRDGTSQIYVLWLDTREVAQLTHLTDSPSGITWSPDGGRLAFSTFIQDTRPILPIKMVKRPKGAKWAKPAVLVDRLSWGRDGVGPTRKGFTQLFVIDSVLGGTPKQITSGYYSHSDPQWSADGNTIYFSAIRKAEAEYLRGDSEIYSIDLKTLNIKALTTRKGPDRGARVSPDGNWIAYTGYDDKNYTSHLSNLYLMRADGTRKRLLAGGLASSPSGVTWSYDSSSLYYLLAEKGTSHLFSINLKGKVKQITDGIFYFSGLNVSRNGQVALTRSSFYEPATLVTFPLKRPTQVHTLVDLNRDVLEGLTLGRIDELWFKSPDGLDLQGWLIKPARFETGKKYPLILYIHGGPWSMYSVRFNWAWQNFAANGYTVLYMNPRGSTGYGQDFVNGIQYSYPGKDYDDLMAGVDAAIAKGYVDTRNLFVCGGSGGGVLTAWIVGHTDRFTAAVSMRPVINWHSFVGNTDGSSWYRQFKNYPWEDPMEYAVRSPLHFVKNVTTPTMVMTGEADLRTPMTQSEEYYRALKMLKKDTLLVRMPEEFHGWRRPSHRILQQLYLRAWFEKYMEK